MSEAGDINLSVEVTKGTLAKFTQAILGFVGLLIFTRVLEPTSLGGYYLLVSVIGIVDKPVIGGVASAARKRFSEADASRGRIVGTLVGMNLVFLVVVGALAFLLDDWLSSYTGLENAAVHGMVLLATIIFFYPFQKLVGARGKIGAQLWNDTLRSLFTFVFQVALVVLGLGAVGMVYGLAGATLLTVPVTYYFVRSAPAVPDRPTVKSIWEFAKHSVPTSLVGKVYNRYDVLLLGALVTPAAVADYQVAFKLTLPGMFVGGVIGGALMPKVSNLASRDEAFRGDVRNGVAYGSVLSIPIFYGAVAIPRALVGTAYGSQYVDAGVFLVWLAAFRMVRSQSTILQNTLNGIDRPDLDFRISAITLLSNVLLGVVLVLAVGGVGVAIATLVTELFRYLAMGVALKRQIPGVELVPDQLRYQHLAGVVMYLFTVTLAGAVPIRSWLELGVVVLPSAAIYFLVYFGVSQEARRLAQELGGGIRA